MFDKVEGPVILIGRSDSSCSACLGPANLNETRHTSGGVVWEKGKDSRVLPGCGVEWVARRPMYIGDHTLDNSLFNWDDMSQPFFRAEALPFKLEGTGEWADE